MLKKRGQGAPSKSDHFFVDLGSARRVKMELPCTREHYFHFGRRTPKDLQKESQKCPFWRHKSQLYSFLVARGTKKAHKREGKKQMKNMCRKGVPGGGRLDRGRLVTPM